MDLTSLHGYVAGFTIIGSWLVVGLWGLVLRLVARQGADTPVFWRAVSVAQILLVLQLLLGLVLIVLGRRPGPPGAGAFTFWFHLAYGIGFPLLVLFFAHKWAREGRWNPHAVFAVVGLVIAGLTARGWQVGIYGA